MTASWFKAKSHGYGAVPASWQGWALTGGYIAAMTLVALLWLTTSPGAPRPSLAEGIVWIALMVIVTFGFVRLARTRTAGEWRWRWGRDAG